jgi:hypothetical protein
MDLYQKFPLCPAGNVPSNTSFGGGVLQQISRIWMAKNFISFINSDG